MALATEGIVSGEEETFSAPSEALAYPEANATTRATADPYVMTNQENGQQQQQKRKQNTGVLRFAQNDNIKT